MDMQEKLDEALDELAMRKKEQAEYKGKDRAHALVVKNVSSTTIAADILARGRNRDLKAPAC